MKSILLAIITVLVLCGTSNSQSSLWDPDRLRFYDNDSTYRCWGRMIYLRDSQRSVLEKCGNPFRKAFIRDGGYKVWIYMDDPYVYYLLFQGSQLERIKSTRCWSDNPDCEAPNSQWDRWRNFVMPITDWKIKKLTRSSVPATITKLVESPYTASKYWFSVPFDIFDYQMK